LFHSGTSARGPICIQPSAVPSSIASRPGGGPASMRALMKSLLRRPVEARRAAGGSRKQVHQQP